MHICYKTNHPKFLSIILFFIKPWDWMSWIFLRKTHRIRVLISCIALIWCVLQKKFMAFNLMGLWRIISISNWEYAARTAYCLYCHDPLPAFGFDFELADRSCETIFVSYLALRKSNFWQIRRFYATANIVKSQILCISSWHFKIHYEAESSLYYLC